MRATAEVLTTIRMMKTKAGMHSREVPVNESLSGVRTLPDARREESWDK